MPVLFIWAMFFTMGPVSVTVSPPFSLTTPAAFHARVIIERHADNRLLELEFDGPEYKYSKFELAGAQRQRVFEPARVEFTTSGEYVALATLTRIEGGTTHRYVARQPFEIRGSF